MLVFAGSLALALAWAFAQPFLEGPDENAHVDYVFALMTAGRLVFAREGTPQYDTHPYTRALERATNFHALRYNVDGRVPAGYGSRAAFARIDREAPPLRSLRVPNKRRELPILLYSYPAGFYAYDALAARLAYAVSGNSVVAAFLAARIACSLLLLVTLAAAYPAYRLMHFSKWETLAMVAAIGFFPLASSTTGYVQPDDLSLALVGLALLAAMRWREKPFEGGRTAFVALVLAALVLTKLQYALAAALPVCALVATAAQSAAVSDGERRRKRVTALAALLGAVSAAELLSVTITATPQRPLRVPSVVMRPASEAAAHGATALAAYVAREAGEFVKDAFYGGMGFASYWDGFGWMGWPIVVGNGRLTAALLHVVAALSFVVGIAFVTRQYWLARRLLAVARARGPATAARLVFADVALNVYAAWFALECTIAVATDGQWTGHGRYWLPVIVPALVLPVRAAWRPLPRASRRTVGRAFATALAAYAFGTAYFGLTSLRQQYYSPATRSPRIEFFTQMEVRDALGDVRLAPAVVRCTRGDVVRFSGWAAAVRTGARPRSIRLLVDGASAGSIQSGEVRPDAEALLNEPGFLHAGFSAELPTANLSAGRHVVSLAVDEGGIWYRSNETHELDVRLARSDE